MTYIFPSLCSLRALAHPTANPLFSLPPLWRLADIPVSPTELFSFLGCFLFGLGVYALLVQIQVNRKKLNGDPQQIQPSPLIVKESARYVHREEFNRLVERLDATDLTITEMREEMRKDSNRLSKEGEERSRRLHLRIEQVCQSLGHEIGAMPERIIGLLKSTGAIGGGSKQKG